MLNQGAILSRYFAMTIIQRKMGIGRLRGNDRWATSLDTGTIMAVMNEAHRIYGKTYNLSSHQTDGTELRNWTDIPSRMSTLTDEIREIFEVGRFAVFTEQDSLFQGGYPICSAIAKHPELLDIMIKNGYEYTTYDQTRLVKSIMDELGADEEVLYQRLDQLLIDQPYWQMSASTNTFSQYFKMPYKSTYSPVALNAAEQAILDEHDGVGPIEPVIKVMKRFHDQGRAFLDLDEAVMKSFQDCVYSSSSWSQPKPADAAPVLRILTKMFPSILEKYKGYTAGEW
jgi:hypothetical protein